MINGNGKAKPFNVSEKELFQNEKAKATYNTWKKKRTEYDPREAGSRAALDAARNELHAILDPHVRKVKDKQGNLRVPDDRWWKLGPLLKGKALVGITIEVLEQPMKGNARDSVGLFTAE
jgi:hypothetical protein